MDAWERMFQEEADTLTFLLSEEFKEVSMTEQQEQQPYLGQRCAVFADLTHQKMLGFGTLVNMQEVRVKGTGGTITHVRVELDAQGSHWYKLSQVELLPTYPAV